MIKRYICKTRMMSRCNFFIFFCIQVMNLMMIIMMMKMTLMIMTLACVGADDEKVDNDDNDENKDDKKNGYATSAWPQRVVMTRMTIRRITMILMTLMILTLLRVGADGKQIMRRSVQEASLALCSYASVPLEWPCCYSLVMPMFPACIHVVIL